MGNRTAQNPAARTVHALKSLMSETGLLVRRIEQGQDLGATGALQLTERAMEAVRMLAYLEALREFESRGGQVADLTSEEEGRHDE